MRLRKYCVTVMDNWTPLRLFWTERGMRKFAASQTFVWCWWWNGYNWINLK